MRRLRPLTVIAVVVHLLIFMLYGYGASQPGGTGASMYLAILWIPIWLITMILATVFVIRGRKALFKNPVLKWTILTLLFCTPFPIYLLFHLTHNTKTYMVGSGYNTKDGKVYKTEEWKYYKSLKTYVNKYFVADSARESQAEAQGQEAFRKDSTWLYFKENGDTLKVERYKNDTLLFQKEYEN